MSTSTILEDFGTFVVEPLLTVYYAIVEPEWRTLDVLEHTERTIHTVVRRRNPGATPPALRTQRLSSSGVEIRYSSPRRMCAFARGLIGGIANDFNEAIEILEPACMLRGGSECVLLVRRDEARSR